MLTDLDLQHDYRSGRDALLDDFYIPCLQESISYDRAVGFFSGSLIQVAAIAYSDFVQRGGQMRLICSPALRPADFDAIQSGLALREIAQQSVRDGSDDLLNIPEAVPATRLLATLVATEVLDVRIAFVGQSTGIFHDKLGLFRDLDGRAVSFVGSANETWAAWGLNHESFEVFRSWQGETDLLRTRRHAEYFESLWAGNEEGVTVEPFQQVTRDRLLSIAEADLDHAIDAVRRRSTRPSGRRTLMPHQQTVLESWRLNQNRGVVSFATGAGKTLVALSAVREWTGRGDPALILVPGRDLHRQWLKEIIQEMPEASPLLCGADSNPATWRDLLSIFSGSERITGTRRIVLSTNATFRSPDFQERFSNGEHLLIVADEMHRMGSRLNLGALTALNPGGRMGLSATYQRKFDDAGTSQLLDWFGGLLDPVLGIAEAIVLGLLVPYDYRLHTMHLDSDEFERYEELTKRIRRLVAWGNRIEDEGGQLQKLLIDRGRVLKQARGKANEALRILAEEYRPGERWLVYCDSVEQLQEVISLTLSEGLPVIEYHSSMVGDKDAALSSFSQYGGIIVAIRCLDEGVDIPSCDRALILASSTVDREYVQRRGRVLRTAPGKLSATVHDLLLIDANDGVLTKSEAARALEFARIARNPAARARLQLLIALSQDVDGVPAVASDDDEESE